MACSIFKLLVDLRDGQLVTIEKKIDDSNADRMGYRPEGFGGFF